MKYIVENYDTCEDVAIFNTEEERSKWIKENTICCMDDRTGEDYYYTRLTNIRISIYER